jgi:hypothetical protein
VHFLKSGIVAGCVLLLTACQALRDEADVGSVSVRGVAPTLEHLNISKDTAAQDAFVNDLIRKAGLDYTPRPGDYSWGFVAEAGIYEIRRQCDQYLDVLFRFNRNQRAIRQGLTATGAATASILGVAGVVAMPIAITAVAFGLAASLYDAGVNSVLFTIEPSALRNVVLKGRQAYIRKLDLSKVNSRPRLLIALQGYLTQCSPATIEANVNNAASGAESVVTMRPGASADGAILGAPGVTLIERATPPSMSTAVPATPPQAAAVVIEQPVTPTPLVIDDNLARNRKLPTEVGITKRMLIDAQKALGVEADGNFGPRDDSATRIAIREFQLGANRRDDANWPDADTKGVWTSRTNLLRFLSPMDKTIFRTPFERAYLGAPMVGDPTKQYTVLDRDQVLSMIAFTKAPSASLPPDTAPNFMAEAMKLLRARLAELRTQRNIEPKRGGELDSVLFDSLASVKP